MTKTAQAAYAKGFAAKCHELGVNASALVKKAQWWPGMWNKYVGPNWTPGRQMAGGTAAWQGMHAGGPDAGMAASDKALKQWDEEAKAQRALGEAQLAYSKADTKGDWQDLVKVPASMAAYAAGWLQGGSPAGNAAADERFSLGNATRMKTKPVLDAAIANYEKVTGRPYNKPAATEYKEPEPPPAPSLPPVTPQAPTPSLPPTPSTQPKIPIIDPEMPTAPGRKNNYM